MRRPACEPRHYLDITASCRCFQRCGIDVPARQAGVMLLPGAGSRRALDCLAAELAARMPGASGSSGALTRASIARRRSTMCAGGRGSAECRTRIVALPGGERCADDFGRGRCAAARSLGRICTAGVSNGIQKS